MRAVWLGLLVACEGPAPDDSDRADADRDGVPAEVDCDDADADVGGPAVWAGDCDADGAAGDVVSDAACAPPATPPCESGVWLASPTGQDCDDANADAVAPTPWFVDCDDDDAFAEAGSSCGAPGDACAPDDTPPEALTDVPPAALDCDDGDAAVGGPRPWFGDCDGDGSLASAPPACAAPVDACDGGPGTGWTDDAPASLDCDDGDDGVSAPPDGVDCDGNATVEDCVATGDEDRDGLVDCEDDDCAAHAACVELACADDLDNDGDGAMDCVDPDCWGHGCPVTAVRFTAGRVARSAKRWSERGSCTTVRTTTSGYVTSTTFYEDARSSVQFDAYSVEGVIRRFDAAGHVGDCAFAVARARAAQTRGAHNGRVLASIQRTYVDQTGDCGVAFYDVAAEVYGIDHAGSGRWVGRFERGVPNPWYNANPAALALQVETYELGSGANGCQPSGDSMRSERGTWDLDSDWIVVGN